ncbi:outer membrane protein assembly factor BamE [Phenylobacterium sp.]|uniref:outer membrane protein assembly factor BamE n=1 Tax=Phenylobacterium sp. TaxID=1871053 RepID=UPI002F4177A4
MFRSVAYAAVAASLLGAAACAPINSYHGFQAIESDPKDVQAGTDTKSTVRGRLGTPSATSTFDQNTWYYVNSVSARVAFRRPAVIARNVTAVTFNKDSEIVETVNHYTLKDGKVIAYNGRETPTRGREMTVLEQLLGTVGRGSMLPQDDQGPGRQSPGQ